MSLWAFRLRSCPQGRRATGYVRNAPTLALARGTPKKYKSENLNSYSFFSLTLLLQKISGVKH
ncbi:MAG: hypothetical protein NZ519_07860 [Bacteroidia bacterium]|nr:hypothetical protein [Bacteroidia bacterium]